MNNQDFEALDLLTLLSFMAQITNMNKDEEYHEIIHQFFIAISNEVEKLHKENNIIMKQNEEILRRLDKLGKL